MLKIQPQPEFLRKATSVADVAAASFTIGDNNHQNFDWNNQAEIQPHSMISTDSSVVVDSGDDTSLPHHRAVRSSENDHSSLEQPRSEESRYQQGFAEIVNDVNDNKGFL